MNGDNMDDWGTEDWEDFIKEAGSLKPLPEPDQRAHKFMDAKARADLCARLEAESRK